MTDRQVAFGIGQARRFCQPEFRRLPHSLIGLQRSGRVSGETVKVANIDEKPVTLSPNGIGNLFLFDLLVEAGSAFQGLDCCLVVQLRTGDARIGDMCAGFRNPALDKVPDQRLARLGVDPGSRSQPLACLGKGTEGQLFLGLSPKAGHLRVTGGKRLQLLFGVTIGLGCLRQLLGTIIVR